MAKTRPFSIRLSPDASRLVEEEMRRSGRSRSAVVEEFAEEAAKTRLFPGIAFRGPQPRRPWVVGTGLDVWQIVELYREYEADAARLIEDHENVSESALQLSLAYADRYPEEIEQALADNRRPLEEWQALYPFIRTTERHAG
jgi:uncharacterized protein (DUF433 family)